MEPDSRRSLSRGRPLLSPAALLGIPVELREDDDRNGQFLGQGLEAAGDFRDLDLAIVLRAPRGRAQELEVIDEDGLDPVLAFEPPRLRAQLEDRNARRCRR